MPEPAPAPPGRLQFWFDRFHGTRREGRWHLERPAPFTTACAVNDTGSTVSRDSHRLHRRTVAKQCRCIAALARVICLPGRRYQPHCRFVGQPQVRLDFAGPISGYGWRVDGKTAPTTLFAVVNVTVTNGQEIWAPRWQVHDNSSGDMHHGLFVSTTSLCLHNRIWW